MKLVRKKSDPLGIAILFFALWVLVILVFFSYVIWKYPVNQAIYLEKQEINKTNDLIVTDNFSSWWPGGAYDINITTYIVERPDIRSENHYVSSGFIKKTVVVQKLDTKVLNSGNYTVKTELKYKLKYPVFQEKSKVIELTLGFKVN